MAIWVNRVDLAEAKQVLQTASFSDPFGLPRFSVRRTIARAGDQVAPKTGRTAGRCSTRAPILADQTTTQPASGDKASAFFKWTQLHPRQLVWTATLWRGASWL